MQFPRFAVIDMQALLSRKKICALALCVAWLGPLATYAQGPETVGRIEGDDIAVKGEVSLLREGGRNTAELVSGAEVTVRSGLARITLADGGEIDVCGPAHFTVLKSGGSLTVALNQGRIHVRVSSAPAIAIYMALVVATPISVGNAPRDATVGVEPDGSLCFVAAHGAVRLEQQLTGQSLVVPEGGEVILPGGQLEALKESRGTCQCEPVFARKETAPKPPQLGAVAVGPSEPSKTENVKKEAPKPATEEPRWTVVMPALTFDATKPPPALPPRPETILLVREVRVQPVLLVTGRVEKPQKFKNPKKQKSPALAAAGSEQKSTGTQSVATPAPAAEAKSDNVGVTEQKSSGGFGTKLKNFFRRLFGAKPKN